MIVIRIISILLFYGLAVWMFNYIQQNFARLAQSGTAAPLAIFTGAIPFLAILSDKILKRLYVRFRSSEIHDRRGAS